MKAFDERLFVLKLQEPSQWMQAETATRERQVDSEQRKLGQGFGAGWLAKRVDSAIGVLREYLPKVDQCCRETWLSDHDAITPEFIRRELVPRIFTVIAARKGTIQWELKLLAGRTRIGGTRLTPALHHLVRQAAKLENGVATQYEIEAVEIAKRTQVRAGAQVPPPVRSLSGFTMALSARKPSQIPPDYRPYFPNELKAKTQVILAEAVRKFPEQAQVLDLCKHVISEMTPVFRAAVASEIMRPDQAISDAGMEGLIHSLLVYNCERDNERYRLGQDVRRSDEWLKLAIEIAEASDLMASSRSQAPTGARGGTQVKITRLGQNIDKFRKECGWSYDQLASKTGLDKKQIISHVNKGTKPIPRNLKLYADAFTKEIGQTISVSDLEN